MKTLAYGVSALVLAGTVIFSGTTLGFLNPGPSGVLSVLLTDPPSVPDGVSAVYITYSGISIHAAGFGDNGWVAISGSGTIDTMKLVNLSQTISTGSIPNLRYDQITFTISRATVDFMGKNYTAAVSSGKIRVSFIGGLDVNSTYPAAALIDLQPTVLNLGSRVNPDFTLAAGAKALQVPAHEVESSLKLVGSTFDLEGHDWFTSFRANHSERITGSVPTLTANSLSFAVTNTGSDPIAVRMVVVTPATHGGGEREALDSIASGVVFAVQAGGSLKLLSGSPTQIESLLESPGYTIAPGATFQFSYSGTITGLLGGGGIKSGGTYDILAVGSEAISAQIVVAS